MIPKLVCDEIPFGNTCQRCPYADVGEFCLLMGIRVVDKQCGINMDESIEEPKFVEKVDDG